MLSWFIVGFFTCAALEEMAKRNWGVSAFYTFVVIGNLLSALEVF